MEVIQGEIILYGLKQYKETIEFVTKKLEHEKNGIALKLILTEALSNAYRHGNKSDDSKPIYLRYWRDSLSTRFEIQDSGNIDSKITLPDDIIGDKDVMDEEGRGLFLIKCFVDNMIFEHNTLMLYISNSKLNEGSV